MSIELAVSINQFIQNRTTVNSDISTEDLVSVLEAIKGKEEITHESLKELETEFTAIHDETAAIFFFDNREEYVTSIKNVALIYADVINRDSSEAHKVSGESIFQMMLGEFSLFALPVEKDEERLKVVVNNTNDNDDDNDDDDDNDEDVVLSAKMAEDDTELPAYLEEDSITRKSYILRNGNSVNSEYTSFVRLLIVLQDSVAKTYDRTDLPLIQILSTSRSTLSL